MTPSHLNAARSLISQRRWPNIFSEIEGLAKWCPEQYGIYSDKGRLPFPAPETNHDRDQPSLCQARTRANRVNATNISTHINTHQHTPTHINTHQHTSKVNIHEIVEFGDFTFSPRAQICPFCPSPVPSPPRHTKAPKIQSAANAKQNPCQVHGAKDGFSLWQPWTKLRILEDQDLVFSAVISLKRARGMMSGERKKHEKTKRSKKNPLNCCSISSWETAAVFTSAKVQLVDEMLQSAESAD